MNIIFVSLRALKAAWYVCPQAANGKPAPNVPKRPGVEGIHIEASLSETRIVATDSLALVIMRETAPNMMNPGETLCFTIPQDVVAELPGPGQDLWDAAATVSVSILPNGTSVLQCGPQVIEFQAVAASFPDYRKFIPAPDTQTCLPAVFDPRVLVGLEIAADLFCGEPEETRLRVCTNGPGKPITVQTTDKNFFGLLMPTTEDDCKHQTDWVHVRPTT